MHILEEWRLRDIEQKADRAIQRLYEIDSINSNLASMERSIRETCSENASLRNELYELQQKIERYEWAQ